MAKSKTKKKSKPSAKAKVVKKKKTKPAAKAKVVKKKKTISAVKAKAAKKGKTKVVKASPKKTVAKKASSQKTPEKKEVIKKDSILKSFVVPADASIEQKLKALYDLQLIDSQIDKIRTVRGELPLEVRDLEDEIEGLETRINNYTKESDKIEESIKIKKNEIKDIKLLIKKYEEQQKNVRNNREYESLSKEIEFQNLEIQLAEKKIKEIKTGIDAKKSFIDQAQENLKELKEDSKHKRSELEEIIAETKKEEEKLVRMSGNAEKIIEDRLIIAYKRIKSNARNGLAVVSVERDSCGGCFNKIPPQRQLDIRMHKKIIVCEHCGRILVNPEIESVKI